MAPARPWRASAAPCAAPRGAFWDYY